MYNYIFFQNIASTRIPLASSLTNKIEISKRIWIPKNWLANSAARTNDNQVDNPLGLVNA